MYPTSHENTLGGNPIVMAAALAVLKVISEESVKLAENARNIGEYAMKRLLLLGAGPSSIRLAPPLIITKQQTDIGLEVFEEH